MLYKFSATQDYDFGMEPTTIVVDESTFIKRASARDLLKYAKTKGQTDLHVIALGAYEGTGFNRNLDMFKAAECAKNYHYFKDSDRAVHRHHKNKPEDPKYGNIKAAAWNAPMNRIELIVGLDDDKCSDIIQEQEKTGSTNWSMASKQAYDKCTWCGHKAATDDDRCDHIPNKLGELNKQGEICGMENPDPKWFEISYVRRPADRIGMSLGKVASHSAIAPMLPRDYLKIYTGFVPPEGDLYISKKASDKRSVVSKAAAIEKHIDAVGLDQVKKRIQIETKKIASDVMDELRKIEPARFFKLAADKGVILSPENFVTYVFGDRVKEAAVQGMKQHLSGIFQQLEKDGGEVCNSEKYEPASFVINTGIGGLVNKLACDHSLHSAYVANRLVHKVAGHTVETKTSDALFDKELAKQYVAYKVAALNYLSDNNRLSEDFLFNAVLQNRN